MCLHHIRRAVQILCKSIFSSMQCKEEKDYLDSCIPKATRYTRKWAFNIFGEWQSSRRNYFTIYDCRDL